MWNGAYGTHRKIIGFTHYCSSSAFCGSLLESFAASGTLSIGLVNNYQEGVQNNKDPLQVRLSLWSCYKIDATPFSGALRASSLPQPTPRDCSMNLAPTNTSASDYSCSSPPSDGVESLLRFIQQRAGSGLADQPRASQPHSAASNRSSIAASVNGTRTRSAIHRKTSRNFTPTGALSQVHGANADSTLLVPPRRRTATNPQSVSSIIGRPLNPHPDYQQSPEPSKAPSVHHLLRKSTIQTSVSPPVGATELSAPQPT
ncbi:hypothetical protein C8J57DRAFT_1469748 [Mycena rebaudengoi]|nr:hypothetical protein C8J57DRAFT_1469748 [Mycena rebaudengoi]